MIGESKIIARYGETDQMGIIHHSVYAMWYEVGRNEFIKKAGMSYVEMEKLNIMNPITDMTCKYMQASHFEDEITIQTRLTLLTPTRSEFQYTLYKNGMEKPVNLGMTRHGWVDASNFRPMNFKKRFPDIYALILASMEPEDRENAVK